MHREKVDLENQLEAEQEYIMNKLHKQVRWHGRWIAGTQQQESRTLRYRVWSFCCG